MRRKTAQYLLKAEALYSTYLAGNDSYEKSEVHVTTNWLTYFKNYVVIGSRIS